MLLYDSGKTRRNQDAEDSLCAKRDMTFWLELDNHLSKAGLAKFQDQQALILTDEEEPVGILRYQLFWDTIPFVPCWWSTNPSREKGEEGTSSAFGKQKCGNKGMGCVWPLLSLMRAVSISIENVATKMPVGCLWTYQVLNSRWNCFCEAVVDTASVCRIRRMKNRSDRHVFLEK